MKGKVRNKKVIIPIISILLVLVIAGISFAYYSATVSKVNETDSKIKTGSLAITFNGTKEINYENMIPGDSFTKTFTVTNESQKAVTFNIYMQNITNEYNEDLVYNIIDDLNEEIVSETKLPSTSVDKKYLQTDIEIAAGATRTYTMTIEYKYLANAPQNDYQGKVFNATLGVDTNINAMLDADLVISLKKLVANNIEDGTSINKTFTITNTTEDTLIYNLLLTDVVNTYANGLKYTLSKNGSQVVSTTSLPNSDSTILSNQALSSGSTDTYVMTITYDSTQAIKDDRILEYREEFIRDYYGDVNE